MNDSIRKPMSNQIYIWGIALLGIAFLVGGLYAAYEGYQSRIDVVQSLVNEKLDVQDPTTLLTYEGARAPEGVKVPTSLIDTAEEAHNQAKVIRIHTLSITEGQTYSDMDREDPNRDFYIKSLTLQNSLHQGHVSLEVSRLVIGVGVAFIGLGLGILFIGTPIARKVTI